MKRLFTLFFMLSFLLTGMNATVKTVLSWDFATYAKKQADKTVVSYSGTVTVNKVSCDLLTGDFDGLAVQGAAPNAQGAGGWMWRSAGNLYNGNSGGRKLVILNLKKDDVITITSSATENIDTNVAAVTGETNKFTVLADGNAALSITKYANLYTLKVERDVPEGICANPTGKVTGVSNTARIITLACETEGAEIYYSETELSTAEGGTLYSSPITTEAAKIYTYAKASGSTSEVVSVTTGAGTAVTLATPTITKTALANNEYTVTLASNQSSVLLQPTATIKYSIDNGTEATYTAAIKLAVGSTLTAHAEAEGYSNSANVEYTAVVLDESYKATKTIDFTTYAEGKGSNSATVKKTIGSTELEQFLVDDEPVDADFYVNPVSGSNKFYIHVTKDDRGLYCFYGGGRSIGLANVKKDQIIKLDASIAPAAGSNVKALPEYSYGDNTYFQVLADGDCSFSIVRYTYIRNIEVLAQEAAPIELVITDVEREQLDEYTVWGGTTADDLWQSVAFTKDGDNLVLDLDEYTLIEYPAGGEVYPASGTVTETEDADGLHLDATIVGKDGNTYHITATVAAAAIELPLTNCTYANYTSQSGPIEWTGEDADGNHVRLWFNNDGSIWTDGTEYYAKDETSFEYKGVSGTATVMVTLNIVLDATITFDNGKTYHITGTYVPPVFPLDNPTITVTTKDVTIEWDVTSLMEEDVASISIEPNVQVTTTSESFIKSGIGEVNAVNGKVTLVIQNSGFTPMMSSNSFEPQSGDKVTVSFPTITVYKYPTAGGWEELWDDECPETYDITVAEATGISNVPTTVAKNAVIYNLAGQRVSKVNGITIVNGKKYMMK